MKIVCADVTFLMLDLLEIELSSRAHEDEEEKRRQKSANVAIGASAAAGKGSGKSKPTITKPTAGDYLIKNGCTRGGQCSFLHPRTVGRCLRCGSTKHAVADCKRPRQEKTAFPPKGKSKSSQPKAPPTKVEAKVTQEQRLRASQTHSDPFASSSVTIEEVAMHLADGPIRSYCFCILHDISSFHSTSVTDESGVLPPILHLLGKSGGIDRSALPKGLRCSVDNAHLFCCAMRSCYREKLL